MARSDGFDRAAQELGDSVPGRMFRAAADATRRAGRRSVFVARAQAASSGFRALSSESRIGLVTLAIAVAAAVHVALLAFVPARIAPTIPRAAWMAVAVVCAAVAVSTRRTR